MDADTSFEVEPDADHDSEVNKWIKAPDVPTPNLPQALLPAINPIRINIQLFGFAQVVKINKKV
jgi:hypothetical protein